MTVAPPRRRSAATDHAAAKDDDTTIGRGHPTSIDCVKADRTRFNLGKTLTVQRFVPENFLVPHDQMLDKTFCWTPRRTIIAAVVRPRRHEAHCPQLT
jgi:hypothetical protein